MPCAIFSSFGPLTPNQAYVGNKAQVLICRKQRSVEVLSQNQPYQKPSVELHDAFEAVFGAVLYQHLV